MTNVAEDFLTYLNAYNKEAYNKVSSEDALESTIVAIYNEHKAEFDVWKSIPESVRTLYPNQKVPPEVLAMAREGKVITKETIENAQKADQTLTATGAGSIQFSDAELAAIAATAATIAVLGYSAKAAERIAANRQVRTRLSEKLKTGEPLSEEEKAIWYKTRHDDRHTIRKDWKENQPERYIAHLIKRINNGKLSLDETLPEIEALLQRTVELGRAENLYAELHTPKVRLKNMNLENKDILAKMMENHGLNKNILYATKRTTKKTISPTTIDMINHVIQNHRSY